MMSIFVAAGVSLATNDRKTEAHLLAATPRPGEAERTAADLPIRLDARDFFVAVKRRFIMRLSQVRLTLEREFYNSWDIVRSASGARAGLTAFLAGVARTVADKNVTINNILPGAFDTDRLRGTLAKAAEKGKKTLEQAATDRMATIPARRFGEPAEFGAAAAFLCSTQAGYITGQNLLIDGGLFPGAF